ncbi:hypothetical protein FRUB_08041 [Fimbriiglobus ruber]|uniref:Uncharacterized protein n=1 Tax=Fimbriiglobus ruber TaxID=1908690 RepID=A0A225DAA9_9BACT|nr:hypothetical protein FRUB_08041 [Fimbriiglobus ruber]
MGVPACGRRGLQGFALLRLFETKPFRSLTQFTKKESDSLG